MSGARILTDEMIAEIQAYFPRYPHRRAVTLPALHVVQQHLRHVPLQAVAEIAELLELAPAEVQDTLSFYGYFPQQQPHGEVRAWVCRSIELRPAWRRTDPGARLSPAGNPAGRNHARRKTDGGICRMPGGLRARALHARRRPTLPSHRRTDRRRVRSRPCAPQDREGKVSEFQPVLLANVGRENSHTLERLRTERAATRRCAKL